MSDPISRTLSPSELPPEAHSLVLLGRAQSGDAAALQELLARYQDRLQRIVRIKLSGSPLRRLHDSMDVVQSTFLAAFPRIGDVRPTSAASLLSWFAKIAANKLRDTYASETAERRDFRRSAPLESSVEAEPGHRTDEPTPSQAAQDAELRECLDAAVAELPDDQRHVVLQRDYCGESWEQIASELQREEGAVRQLHQRAWIRLRQNLRPFLKERSG